MMSSDRGLKASSVMGSHEAGHNGVSWWLRVGGILQWALIMSVVSLIAVALIYRKNRTAILESPITDVEEQVRHGHGTIVSEPHELKSAMKWYFVACDSDYPAKSLKMLRCFSPEDLQQGTKVHLFRTSFGDTTSYPTNEVWFAKQVGNDGE